MSAHTCLPCTTTADRWRRKRPPHQKARMRIIVQCGVNAEYGASGAQQRTSATKRLRWERQGRPPAVAEEHSPSWKGYGVAHGMRMSCMAPHPPLSFSI